MVNETVYNYLKLYKGKYPLLNLKEEILKKGYNEVDFNEALSKINVEESNRQPLGPVKKLPSFEVKATQQKRSSHLTLILIIVFILVFDVALFFLLQFFGFDFFGFNVFGK